MQHIVYSVQSSLQKSLFKYECFYQVSLFLFLTIFILIFHLRNKNSTIDKNLINFSLIPLFIMLFSIITKHNKLNQLNTYSFSTRLVFFMICATSLLRLAITELKINKKAMPQSKRKAKKIIALCFILINLTSLNFLVASCFNINLLAFDKAGENFYVFKIIQFISFSMMIAEYFYCRNNVLFNIFTHDENLSLYVSYSKEHEIKTIPNDISNFFITTISTVLLPCRKYQIGYEEIKNKHTLEISKTEREIEEMIEYRTILKEEILGLEAIDEVIKLEANAIIESSAGIDEDVKLDNNENGTVRENQGGNEEAVKVSDKSAAMDEDIIMNNVENSTVEETEIELKKKELADLEDQIKLKRLARDTALNDFDTFELKLKNDLHTEIFKNTSNVDTNSLGYLKKVNKRIEKQVKKYAYRFGNNSCVTDEVFACALYGIQTCKVLILEREEQIYEYLNK